MPPAVVNPIMPSTTLATPVASATKSKLFALAASSRDPETSGSSPSVSAKARRGSLMSATATFATPLALSDKAMSRPIGPAPKTSVVPGTGASAPIPAAPRPLRTQASGSASAAVSKARSPMPCR